MRQKTAATSTRIEEHKEVEGYTVFRVNVDTDQAEVVPRPLTPAELPPASRPRPVIFWA